MQTTSEHGFYSMPCYLKLAETMVEIAIRDGLKAELHYKDIYRLCKDRVSDVLGQLLLK